MFLVLDRKTHSLKLPLIISNFKRFLFCSFFSSITMPAAPSLPSLSLSLSFSPHSPFSLCTVYDQKMRFELSGSDASTSRSSKRRKSREAHSAPVLLSGSGALNLSQLGQNHPMSNRPRALQQVLQRDGVSLGHGKCKTTSSAG